MSSRRDEEARWRGADGGVTAEPHLRAPARAPSAATGGLAEEPALRGGARRRPTQASDAEYRDSVFDEPALRGAGASPEGAREDWPTWFARKRRETPAGHSWLALLAVALVAGPFAVLGVMADPAGMSMGLLAVVVFGPLAEETMKVAALGWLLDKRPYLIRSAAQLRAAALASGLGFAAIENVMYLRVYVDAPSDGLVAWRWTVCVGLHVGCTFLASSGLARALRRAQHEGVRPRFADGLPALVAAAVVHGAYNLTVSVAELLDPEWLF